MITILSLHSKVWATSNWLSQVPTEVNNRIQSFLLNYHFALLRSGDFTLVYYQMGEIEYIRTTTANKFDLYIQMVWPI